MCHPVIKQFDYMIWTVLFMIVTITIICVSALSYGYGYERGRSEVCLKPWYCLYCSDSASEKQ